ncbi:5-methylcytosine rRNA methyltransferase NSUN4 [Armadillidium vulgare]|nr:5-methylcytosine rRNA methyltransferase NSUN4 [Armadillidium vulgare]RXG68125.1 5-methylcytosine rRNA methyltransferase NSUN4 [Armadillidium vulgare]
MTKPGGSVVYSTCTLSPLQNDGAVHLALAKIWRETKIDCCVVNMMQTVKNLSFMYAIGHNLKLRYGHIVLPFPDNNCGPMYISKIVRER